MATERLAAVYESFDERFADVGGDRYVECVFDEGRWLEGPAYHPAHRFVLFSDIPNERVLRFDERTGRVDVFDAASGFANGRTVDAQGQISSGASTADAGSRGSSTTARPASSPTASKGRRSTARTTSPSTATARCGSPIRPTASRATMKATPPRPSSPSAGCTASTGTARSRCASVNWTSRNGIAFHHEGMTVYVTDSGTPAIWRAEVRSDGSTGAPERIAEADVVYDGIRTDTLGRLWVAASDGVRCHAADGTLIGRIPLPETVANLEFGGPRGNVLYITATTSLYVLRTTVRGRALPRR